MPKIILNGAIVDDQWIALDDDVAVAIPSMSDAPHLIVPLKIWQARREALVARGGSLGLLLQTNDEPIPFSSDVSIFALIAIHFEKFTDGRGYSLGPFAS